MYIENNVPKGLRRILGIRFVEAKRLQVLQDIA